MCERGAQEGRKERMSERKTVLIFKRGTLKSQCYLVVNPTLSFLLVPSALLSEIPRSGFQGRILPCIER